MNKNIVKVGKAAIAVTLMTTLLTLCQWKFQWNSMDVQNYNVAVILVLYEITNQVQTYV